MQSFAPARLSFAFFCHFGWGLGKGNSFVFNTHYINTHTHTCKCNQWYDDGDVDNDNDSDEKNKHTNNDGKTTKKICFLKMMKEEVHTNEDEKKSQCQQCIAPSTDERKNTTSQTHTNENLLCQ